MIQVDRSSVPAPDSITSSDGVGEKERAKAVEHYSNVGCGIYNFQAYKQPDVVAALGSLFKDKCAYCESHINHTGPTDIEHYRPKGAVVEDNTHSGYWWLASDWDNLLPSCIDCNRERYQLIADESDGDPAQAHTRRLSGKQNYFPLANEKRAKGPADDYALEDPLLIDPTRRDPGVHITWRLRGDLPLAVASRNNGDIDEYGDASIRIYGLNRIKLAEARRLLYLNLMADIINVRRMAEAISMLPPEAGFAMRPVFEEMVTALWNKSGCNQQFSAFASYIIKKELNEVLENLKS